MPFCSKSWIWSKIYFLDSIHFGFFFFFFLLLIFIEICQELINIYNLCYNAAKNCENLKITLLGHYLDKNRASISYSINQVQFIFLEITKGDHKLPRTFYFINISYILTKSWMFFCLVWYFVSIMGRFPLKQLCVQPII